MAADEVKRYANVVVFPLCQIKTLLYILNAVLCTISALGAPEAPATTLSSYLLLLLPSRYYQCGFPLHTPRKQGHEDVHPTTMVWDDMCSFQLHSTATRVKTLC
jgi:hypothetical protein